MPSPPAAARRRRCPAQPERRTRIGNARSSASIGVFCVLVIAVWTPLMPRAGRPAALPAADGLVVHPAGRRR